MALLFLDNTKEASRFSSASKDAYVRITPNHATDNSAIWGIEERCMYFGFGNEDEHVIEKHLFLRDTQLGIGTSCPIAKCDIMDLNGVSNLILNVQHAFQVHNNGMVVIQKTTDTSLFTIHSPSHFQEETSFHANVMFKGPSVTLASSMLDLGNPQSKTTVKGIFHIEGQTYVNDAMTLNAPVLCQKDINLRGNLYMLSDGYANSWYLKNELKASSIVAKHLHLHENGLTVQGGSILLDGTSISLGKSPTNPLPDTVYISKHIELPLTYKLGLGKTPNATLDVVGDISTMGHFMVSKNTSLGESTACNHTIRGNVTVLGESHHWKGHQKIDGKMHITQQCSIGQDYCPALLHVYGPVHIKEHLYAHQTIYADKDIQLKGKLVMNAQTHLTDGLIDIATGSIYIHKGLLYVNASPSLYPTVHNQTFILNGNAFMDGNIQSTGSLLIQQDARIEKNLWVQNNATIEQNLHVQQSLVIDKDLKTHGNAHIQQNLTIGKQLLVQENVYIGTHDLGVLHVNGKCTTSQSIETPMVTTSNLKAHHTFQFQNRRYGIRQPPRNEGYCMKWIEIPYRRGKTSFFVRFKGLLFTATSSMKIDMELGGTTLEPNHKKIVLTGELRNEFYEDITKYIQCVIYQTKSLDYIGCIRIPPNFFVGYELDIELDGRFDFFKHESIDSNVPKIEQWSIWWNLMHTPHMHFKQNSIHIHRKMGVGEENPLYSLDVKSDARFQGKIYQPLKPNGLIPSSVPSIQHQDQTYYALSDIMQWLIQSVQELQVSSSKTN